MDTIKILSAVNTGLKVEGIIYARRQVNDRGLERKE
jgi:hypothetical protein